MDVFTCEGYPKGECQLPPPQNINYKFKIGSERYTLCLECFTRMVQQEGIVIPHTPINYCEEHPGI